VLDQLLGHLAKQGDRILAGIGKGSVGTEGIADVHGSRTGRYLAAADRDEEIGQAIHQGVPRLAEGGRVESERRLAGRHG
jgi:hypothetical protein